MSEVRKRKNWKEYAYEIIPFIGPIVFEILNIITGDWITEENKLNLSTGKCITIFVGLLYIGTMIYLVYDSIRKKKDEEDLNIQICDAQKRIAMYEKSMDTLGTLLAYLGEKIKEQIEYLNEKDKIDVRSININAASTNIAKIIYQSILERNGVSAKITVNIYSRENINGTEYSTMIAHVGPISQPDALGDKRILCAEKKNIRYCEKTILSNRPDYRILLNKTKVAKAFGMVPSKCKYNQYLGIPVKQMGGQNIALIEIVAHDTEVLWKTEEEATLFAAEYCEVLKEYILLMNRMYEQGSAVAHKMQGGV